MRFSIGFLFDSKPFFALCSVFKEFAGLENYVVINCTPYHCNGVFSVTLVRNAVYDKEGILSVTGGMWFMKTYGTVYFLLHRKIRILL